MAKRKGGLDPDIFKMIRRERIARGEAYWKARARLMRSEIESLQLQVLFADEYARMAKRKGIE